MVVKLTLTVRQVLLSCIIPMVVRCITQGYMKANILAWYQRNLIYQACITSELSYHQLDKHVAWVQVTAGLGFFLCSGCLSDSEDSYSLLLRGLVPKRGLVPRP